MIKQKIAPAMDHIRRFETALLHEARDVGCDGVVCGHIHYAAHDIRDGSAYYNCGDWVESCSALAERFDGSIELIDGLAWTETVPTKAPDPTLAWRGGRLRSAA